MKIHITSEEFRTKEIKNLKKLRFWTIFLLMLINFSIVCFFCYMFYEVYKSRNIAEAFIPYVAPTIIYLEATLLIPFGGISVLIYRRFNFFIEELRDLNDEYLMLYQKFTKITFRAFPHIPLYLISQKGIVLIHNLKKVIIPGQIISEIEIKNVNLGKFGRRCHVKFYDDSKLIDKITYHVSYPPAVGFLKENIDAVNTNIRFRENS